MPAAPMPDALAWTEESNAIYQLVQQIQEAWNRAANTELAALFREDVDYTAWNGIYFHGRTAVLQNHRRIFGARFLDGKLQITVRNIRFLSQSVAAVHVAVRLSGQDGAAACKAGLEPGSPVEGAALFIVTKRGNQWRCEVFHNTLVIQGKAH
jgi:uncharacterized protein (TIGR02246 family)